MENKLGTKSLKILQKTLEAKKQYELTDIETIVYVCMKVLNLGNIHLNMEAIYSELDRKIEIVNEVYDKTIQDIEDSPNIICTSLCMIAKSIVEELKSMGELNIRKVQIQQTPSLEYDERLNHRILVVTLEDGRKIPIDLQKEIVNFQSKNRLLYIGTKKCINDNFAENEGYSEITPSDYERVFPILGYPNNGKYTKDILAEYKQEIDEKDLSKQKKLTRVLDKIKSLKLYKLKDLELAELYKSMLKIFFEKEMQDGDIKLYKYGKKEDIGCNLLLSLKLGKEEYAYYRYNYKESGFIEISKEEVIRIIKSQQQLTTNPNEKGVAGIGDK